MRVAFLSDLHANLEALDACLADVRARGVDQLVFLGDFVGYGADAVAVLEVLMRKTADGAIAIKGNHDEAIGGRMSYFNDQARAALDWARKTMTEDHRQFLADLPLRKDQPPMCFVHATAAAPERWDYIDSAGAAQKCAEASGLPYTFCGHVHDQVLYFETAQRKMSVFTPRIGTAIPMRETRRWVAIVGSVGQPRDRNPAAAYATFDTDRREITFHRIPYDHHAAADKIRRAGLPEALAYRVEAGI
jgi:diadenosine tetraphosphatase ApaH/serine/threonine PP2A family protein phosphatase